MEDDDGNVVRISFIGYTRACCGTYHKKEEGYWELVKFRVEKFLAEESNGLKEYLHSMDLISNVENDDRNVGQMNDKH